jgi:hypothetical protein
MLLCCARRPFLLVDTTMVTISLGLVTGPTHLEPGPEAIVHKLWFQGHPNCSSTAARLYDSPTMISHFPPLIRQASSLNACPH